MIPTFNDPQIEDFGKHCWKRRKCLSTAFSPFPKMFSTLLNANFNFLAKFNLLSANAFNLDHSKDLAFGKELNTSLSHCLKLKMILKGQLENLKILYVLICECLNL